MTTANDGILIDIFGRFLKTGELSVVCDMPWRQYQARSQMTTTNGAFLS